MEYKLDCTRPAKLKGLVRPANGFVTVGKRTNHAEFSYEKIISSNARGSCSRFVEHNSHTMTIIISNGLLSVLSGGNFLTCSKLPNG